jgi:hypothetical protein
MKRDILGHLVILNRHTFEFHTVANNMAGTRTSNTGGTPAPRT